MMRQVAYTLTAELPGFDPSDIIVKASQSTLTIRAEHSEAAKYGNGRVRKIGSFYETFSLPPNVKSDQIDASYRNGVLQIQLPKDQSSPAKRIEVKAA